MRLDQADALRLGTAAVNRLYAGSALLWSADEEPPEVIPPSLRSSSSGQSTGTSAVITLPSGWQAGDYLTLLVSSNQAPTLGFSAGVASSTSIASAGGRLQAIRIVPNEGATQVTLTASVSAVLTWWCGAWEHVDPSATVYAATGGGGSNTTAAIESPTVDLSHIATGHEVFVRAAGVNSTATWDPAPNNIFATISGNAAMAVRSDAVLEGVVSVPAASAFDRGNEGTTRNESSLAFVLQPVQTVVPNILKNASFEDAAVAVGAFWEAEKTVVGTPAWTKSTSAGVVDGGKAQQVQYAGQAGDTGPRMLAIYQSPITATPGQVYTFKIHLAGSKADCNIIVGLEGFSEGMVYIDEHDTVVSTLTSTPTEYEVTYECPSGTIAVAAYVQVNSITPTTAITMQLDKGILVWH